MLPVLIWAALFLLVGLVVYRCLAACGVELPLPGKGAAHFQSGKEQALSCRGAAAWKVFLAALGFRLGLLAVGLFAAMVLTSGESTFQDCFQRFCQRWDGYHYVQLVEKGYTGYQENGQHLFLVFFPGFVWGTRLLRLVIPDTLLAGVALSTLCAAGGSCYVYKLAAQCYNPRVAKDTLLFLSLFPFSFFSGTMMTEGLFLLTTAGACYYALQGRWFLFGLLGVGGCPHPDDRCAGGPCGGDGAAGAGKTLEGSRGKLLAQVLERYIGEAALCADAPFGHRLLPAAQPGGGRRPLCLYHPPGALVPRVPVDALCSGIYVP